MQLANLQYQRDMSIETSLTHDNNGVFDLWRNLIIRQREENEFESFELQDVHERVGSQLLDFLEELEGDFG